ncbi:carboxyl-terminal processing protease [Neisseria sp. HSC-16F19]|nr:S41 family peptidase [Neisseria sp. HSC-16F19]MCP2040420.1 carboxyl-terminal processing protease [Neisseria sp. HSC-16F19]
MAKATLKKIALYTAGAFSGALLTLSIQSYANEQSKEVLPVQSIRTLAEVYGQIKANYYENKTDEQILEGAMKGMVDNLDPHSEYMSSKNYADLRENTSGEFGGLGMEIGSEEGYIKVVAPIEDTPAERAGIQSGDLIIKINDESTRGMSTTDAVKKMRGKPGTDITLTLSRKDSAQPIVVKLTRAVIKVKSVRHHLLEQDYGYVRITQFQEPTLAALADAVADLRKQNGTALKGLVLDLRDDPGGLLNGAVGVSAAFLPEGAKVVSTKGRNARESMNLSATPKDYMMGWTTDPLAKLPPEIKNIPVTVLINSGSASASEIVAGALQDHKRAVIVGTQSFGKGSVQSVLPLANGGAIKLTTALYYTPNDRSIQAQGIVPDVEVQDKNRRFESREADLGGHLSNPTGGTEVKGRILPQQDSTPAAASATAASATEDKDEDRSSRRIPNPAKDDQLRKALDLVKDPAQWQKSLGLAAKKPAPKKAADQ